MARPRKPPTTSRPKGTVIKLPDGRWQPRIRLLDGTRPRGKPYPLGTSETMAREHASAMQERAIAEGWTSQAEVDKATESLSPGTGCDACEKWVDLWNAERKARGLSSAFGTSLHWKNYLRSVLGKQHPRAWKKDDFRRLSKALDEKVQSGAVSWKTAVNIWGTATKMADDACNAKDDAIRCRDDNPAEGVRGPFRGAKTARQYLFPSEVTQLLECDKVPLVRRRMFAVAVYTYCRASELKALTWDDVDLDRRIIHVTKAFNEDTGGVKSTKSKCPRTIPIEPELWPLLKAMHDECGGLGSVVQMPRYTKLATGLKRWLKVAGIERRSLIEKGPGVRSIRFHDLRATGITWSAVRGDDPLKIQQRAGHTEFNTTQGYIREADVLRDGFGAPFPALPETMLDQNLGPVIPKYAETLRRKEDSNLW